jgi:hypothetical protein
VIVGAVWLICCEVYELTGESEIMRRLLSLAIMTLVVTMIDVPVVLAQSNPENHETLEVTREPTGVHCAAVLKPTAHAVAGGCLIHATSVFTVELRKHVFGIESHITSCNNEFSGRINEDAEGYIIEQHFAGASCQRQPCIETGESAGTPWPVHGDEAHNPGVDGETGVASPVIGHTEVLTTNLCVEPVGGGADESCEVDIPFNQTGAPHIHELGFDSITELSGHGISGFRCELVGHWISENSGVGEVRIEAIHIQVENKAEVP